MTTSLFAWNVGCATSIRRWACDVGVRPTHQTGGKKISYDNNGKAPTFALTPMREHPTSGDPPGNGVGHGLTSVAHRQHFSPRMSEADCPPGRGSVAVSRIA